MNQRHSSREPSIVVFDGLCNLCDRSVQFVVRHDPRGRFLLCWRQSERGETLMRSHGLSVDEVDSIVLIEGGRAFLRSDAALRIAAGLGWPWKVFRILAILPRPVRDGMYGFVARKRYRWFGRKDGCRVASAAMEKRFLDARAPAEQRGPA